MKVNEGVNLENEGFEVDTTIDLSPPPFSILNQDIQHYFESELFRTSGLLINPI